MKKRILVCGAGGFIGTHVVRRLRNEGHWVRGVDLRHPEFSPTAAHEFIVADLRDRPLCRSLCDGGFDEVYQFAADMGGAGYIFSGTCDAEIMTNSSTLNVNVLTACVEYKVPQIFFSSSACIYPQYNQQDPENPVCAEETAYPALPDSEYGWEKLFAERVYLAHARGGKIGVRIARLHNVYGPENAWRGGREKAPAALCRKVAEAADGGDIEIWGDGRQTRSFLYIDDAVEGILSVMRSDCSSPVNVGSEEMVTISHLAETIIRIAGKRLGTRSISGPQGVRGRTSDNRLIGRVAGWRPACPLVEGLTRTYAWVAQQVAGTSAPIGNTHLGV
jgi:nucleoside-diphosphate-sugar epimerase